MAKYRVIANSVNIHAGVLGLELHQAQARLHRVVFLGGNRYEVIDPSVTFKRGEEFEYDGELPKSLVEALASCPVGAPLVGAQQGQPQGLSLQNPIPTFPPIDQDLVTDFVPDDGVAEPPPDQSPGLFEQDPVTDLVTDLVEGVPDDGVSEMPAGAKKRSRRKPAA